MGQKVDYVLHILTALNPQNDTGGQILVLTLQVGKGTEDDLPEKFKNLSEATQCIKKAIGFQSPCCDILDGCLPDPAMLYSAQHFTANVYMVVSNGSGHQAGLPCKVVWTMHRTTQEGPYMLSSM